VDVLGELIMRRLLLSSSNELEFVVELVELPAINV